MGKPKQRAYLKATVNSGVKMCPTETHLFSCGLQNKIGEAAKLFYHDAAASKNMVSFANRYCTDGLFFKSSLGGHNGGARC